MPVVPHQMSGEFDQDGEQGVALETRTKTKRPPSVSYTHLTLPTSG